MRAKKISGIKIVICRLIYLKKCLLQEITLFNLVRFHTLNKQKKSIFFYLMTKTQNHFLMQPYTLQSFSSVGEQDKKQTGKYCQIYIRIHSAFQIRALDIVIVESVINDVKISQTVMRCFTYDPPSEVPPGEVFNVSLHRLSLPTFAQYY